MKNVKSNKLYDLHEKPTNQWQFSPNVAHRESMYHMFNNSYIFYEGELCVHVFVSPVEMCNNYCRTRLRGIFISASFACLITYTCQVIELWGMLSVHIFFLIFLSLHLFGSK